VTLVWQQPGGGPLHAQADAAYDLGLAPADKLGSCAKILLIILAAIWFLLALLVASRTHRFPRGSVAEVNEDNQMPRYRDLRHSNWTLLRSFLPWYALLLRSPHERTVVEAIIFEAAPHGAVIPLQKVSVDFVIAWTGRSIRDMLAEKPNLERLRVMWNARIERDVGHTIGIKLIRRAAAQI
jgi:hypothetical protein